MLALQEVDRAQPRSGALDLTALAAEAMGARHHRFVAAMTGTPDAWVPADGREGDTSPAYGNALLSRHPVTDWRVVRLPGLPGAVPYRWPSAPRPSWVRDEARVAAVADVDSPLGPLRVTAAHLWFLAPSSGRQLRGLLTEVQHTDAPGRSNMRPARVARLTRMLPLVTARTFPVSPPCGSSTTCSRTTTG